MTRCLIFLASVMLTFVTISSASSASPGGFAFRSPAATRAAGAHWSVGALAGTPSRLSAIAMVGL